MFFLEVSLVVKIKIILNKIIFINALFVFANLTFALYKFFSSLLTSGLVHKNSKLSSFLAFPNLYTSTQFLEHVSSDDGMNDGIADPIDFGTNTGGNNPLLSPIPKLGLPSPPTSQMGRVCTC